METQISTLVSLIFLKSKDYPNPDKIKSHIEAKKKHHFPIVVIVLQISAKCIGDIQNTFIEYIKRRRGALNI